MKLHDLSFANRNHDAYEELFLRLTEMKDKLFLGEATYLRDLDKEAARKAKLDDEDELVPYLIVTDVTRERRRIDVIAAYGKENDYEDLHSRDGSPSVQMKKKAATRKYQVTFHVPSVGTEAIMVSITKGRSYLGETLLQRLNVQSQRGAVSFDGAGTPSETPWIRWRPAPMFDPGRIDTIINEGASHALTLTGRGRLPSGAQSSGTIKLTEQGIPVSRMSDLIQVIRSWWGRKKVGSPEDRSKEGAQELGVLVSADIDNFDYEDGEISFLENGKKQTITPNTIERLFIYPIGDVLPSPAIWRSTVAGKLKSINTGLQIELDLTE
ncbi:hypothetical protein ACX80U_12270 [Arthrobacter sp. TmT3-37]